MQIPFDPNPGPSPFEDVELTIGVEPRAACLLLLDTSGSMSGAPIAQLNEGLALLGRELATDSLAAKRAEIGIVTFGTEVQVVQDFALVDDLAIPRLEASGLTAMSAAILAGADLLTRRKERYKEHGIQYYRPWIFLMTDGAPTDLELWPQAVERLRKGEDAKEFTVFPIGVGSANFDRLGELTRHRPPLRLQGLSFREYFLWLSKSMAKVSSSRTDSAVPLEPTSGWGEVVV